MTNKPNLLAKKPEVGSTVKLKTILGWRVAPVISIDFMSGKYPIAWVTLAGVPGATLAHWVEETKKKG